jgi:predicted butyrate kinase (DUF1464 family)
MAATRNSNIFRKRVTFPGNQILCAAEATDRAVILANAAQGGKLRHLIDATKKKAYDALHASP